MLSTQNQRQHSRFQPRQAISCSDVNGLNIGRVMNLSESGFMLMSNQEAQVNESLILKIDLPLNPVHQITLSSEVIWCQKSSFSEEFGVGIQITNIDDLAITALRRFLNEEERATAA